MLFHAPSFSIGLVLGAAIVLTTGYLPELLAPPPPAPAKTGNGEAGAADSASQPLTFEFDTILSTTAAPVAVGPPEPGQPPAPLPGGTPPGAPAGAQSPPLVGEVENATPGVIQSGVPTVTQSVPIAMNTPAVSTSMPVNVVERAVEADLPPKSAPEPAEPEPAPQPPAATQAAAYMLQAASFRSRVDADRLRAELLLLDLPASTGEVNVGNSLWYRVTVGPFPDQQTADVAKERLRERNLTAIPFKR